RPLGAYLIGRMGDRSGWSNALSLSLIGMGCSSLIIGLTPTYASGGAFSVLFLLFGKSLQNFFSTAETMSGGMAAVESNIKRADLMSGLVSSSTILGMLISSLATAFLYHYGIEEQYWRLLYFAGALTALFGWYLRQGLTLSISSEKEEAPVTPLNFITVVCSTGFSYASYMFCFVTLRGLIPVITGMPQARMAWLSTGALIFDFVLLLFFGWVAMRIGRDRQMLAAATLGPLCCFLFSPLLTSGSEGAIALYLAIAVISGTAFSAPLFSWMHAHLPSGRRGRSGALAYALGSQLIGGPTAIASMTLFNRTFEPWTAALYLFATGLLAASLQLTLIWSKSKSWPMPSLS
ncbi:MAG: MFS transporter, partial [Chlamydiia bacterium]|nr:MFS transporter [Chlamydiia bacterium]